MDAGRCDRGTARPRGRPGRPRRRSARHDEWHPARPTRARAAPRQGRRESRQQRPRSRSRCGWSARRSRSAPPSDARKRLAELGSVMSGDWRLKWYSGQCALLEGEFDKAAADFDAVLAMLPGELAPKLAIAATAELRGARDDADALLRDGVADGPQLLSAPRSAWRGSVRERETGPTPIAATRPGPVLVGAFHRGGRHRDRDPARRPRHPRTSTSRRCSTPASARRHCNLESAAKRATIRLRVLGAALDWLRQGTRAPPRVCSVSTFDEPGIRTGMERAYRDLARETTEMWERIALVEKANAIRPRTRL